MKRWESQILIYMKIVGQHIAKLLLVNDVKPMVKAFKGGGGVGMVTDFSGTSILSNEFVVIGRASTDKLR